MSRQVVKLKGGATIKKESRVLALACVAAVVTACGSSSSGGASSKGTIALAMSAVNQVGLAYVQKDLETAAKNHGYKFIWTDGKADPSKELSDVKDLISKKPDLLVVDPVEAAPLDPVAKLACGAKVLLMGVDRAIPTAPGTCTYLAFFSWDWVHVGQQIGDSVVNWANLKHGGKANLVHITGIAAASPTIDVATGEQQVFAQHPDIKVVATCDGMYQRDASRKCMEDLLQRFRAGQIDGVLADNDDGGLGALDAIKAAGRSELIGPIWTHDATKPYLEAMLSSETYMTVRRPIAAGEQIIAAFEKYKSGQKINTLQNVPTTPYEASTPAGKQAVQARIDDLTKLGLTDN